MDDLKELKQDVKEVKQMVSELVKQGAVHNHILKEHERRSTNLEHRFAPVEDTYKFLSKAGGVMIMMTAAAGAVLGILRALGH